MPADALVHSVAGSVGGMLAMTLTFPLLTISSRAQLESADKTKAASLFKTIKLTLQRDGLGPFFDGLDSSIIAIGTTNLFYYFAFEESRARLLSFKVKRGNKSNAALSTVESLLISSFAGGITSILVNPIWVVNTRQTTARSLAATSAEEKDTQQAREFTGFFPTLIRLLREEGLHSLFAGLGPSLILVINPILQYTLFEQLKNLLVRRRTSKLPQHAPKTLTDKPSALPLGDLDYFVLGAISKLFATGLTFPYLNLRTRMQADKKDGTYTDGLLAVLRKEGVGALYQGVAPKLTQSVLSAAILFMTKEKLYLALKAVLSAEFQRRK